jgi:hypothetical protein
MHWKKRQKQIQYLRAKHGNDRSLAREFPDRKVEQRTAPCSNGMWSRTGRRVLPPGMKQFPVGHCHKQGYELIYEGFERRRARGTVDKVEGGHLKILGLISILGSHAELHRRC